MIDIGTETGLFLYSLSQFNELSMYFIRNSNFEGRKKTDMAMNGELNTERLE